MRERAFFPRNEGYFGWRWNGWWIIGTAAAVVAVVSGIIIFDRFTYNALLERQQKMLKEEMQFQIWEDQWNYHGATSSKQKYEAGIEDLLQRRTALIAEIQQKGFDKAEGVPRGKKPIQTVSRNFFLKLSDEPNALKEKR